MAPIERLFTVMAKPRMMLGYLALVLWFFLYIDKPLANYLYTLDVSAHVPWLNVFTRLGESKYYLAGLLVLALFWRYVMHNRAWEMRTWFLWLCVFISNLICLVLKVFLGRARPDLWFHDQLYGFYGFHRDSLYWSFPSGHTTTIIGLACGLGLLFPRFAWLYLSMGVLVIVSRVLLLQHYLSDVMIAADLALLEVGVLWILLRRHTWFTRALAA